MKFGKRCDGLILEGVGGGIEDWIWSTYTANICKIFKKFKKLNELFFFIKPTT